MIKVIGRMSEIDAVAVSGGPDSMVLLNFLLKGGHKPTVLFMNHSTETSYLAEEFLDKKCCEKELEYKRNMIYLCRNPSESLEEFWRNQRYEWFHSLEFKNIATAHHLDDAVETWLFGAINGTPKLIPYRNKNVVRPLLLNKKSELLDWALDNNVEWIEDESNLDTRFARNRIRHNVVPEVLKINPGIHKVIKKKYLDATKS